MGNCSDPNEKNKMGVSKFGALTKNTKIIIAIVVLLILIGGGVGFYVYKKRNGFGKRR